ncbi:hypothetical protein [Candidatus Pantoea bituminis]|uniref:hypothetical protein n=1 Tax=Candidatus Pantoea bituminis TaxID=2831036 RepID=UPI001C060081|nr:hypothetical protein [Pantoea bituminis]
MSKRLRLAVELPGEDLLTAISSADHLITNYIKQLNPVYLLLGAERNTPLMGVSPNPGILACWISRRLKNCGLVIAASLQRDHPYNLARRVASFDHISKGRTGILLMAEDHGQSLGLVKRSSWIEEPLSALAVADGMIAMRKLWRTWPRETLHANPEISSAAKVRYAVHQGVFSTSGPLNSPTTLQGNLCCFGM